MQIDVEVQNMLRYDEGRQAAWSLAGTHGNTREQLFVFFFRWQRGAETALRARSHRPDVCLPSVGWRKTADHGVRTYAINEQLTLPFRHFSFARTLPGERAAFAEAFFCVHEDKVRPRDASAEFLEAEAPVSDWSRAERLRVVREGLRNTGQQVLQVAFVLSSEIEPGVAQKKFSTMLPDLVDISHANR
jgi:hypothetical protein